MRVANQDEFDAIQRRIDESRGRSRQGSGPSPVPVTPGDSTATSIEKQLHADIIKLLNERRILFFHGSMAHKTHRTAGEPDFTVVLPNGITLWIECKTRTGKLDENQNIVRHRLVYAGHKYAIVRSLAQFKEALELSDNQQTNDSKSRSIANLSAE